MTLKEMRSNLQVLGDDIAGKKYPVKVYNLHINQAQSELTKLALIKDRRATVDTVADQHDYQLPVYVRDILQVEVYDTDNTVYVPAVGRSPMWFNQNNSSWRDDDSVDHPTNWARMGDRWFIIYPAFDAIVTDGIRIYYTRYGDELSDDGDESYIPVEFHKYIVFQAFVNLFPLHPNVKSYYGILGRAYEEMKAFTHTADIGRFRVQKPASYR